MSNPLADELARFDPSRPLDAARTIPTPGTPRPTSPPPSRRRVFGSTWQMVGRAEQVASPART